MTCRNPCIQICVDRSKAENRLHHYLFHLEKPLKRNVNQPPTPSNGEVGLSGALGHYSQFTIPIRYSNPLFLPYTLLIYHFSDFDGILTSWNSYSKNIVAFLDFEYFILLFPIPIYYSLFFIPIYYSIFTMPIHYSLFPIPVSYSSSLFQSLYPTNYAKINIPT